MGMDVHSCLVTAVVVTYGNEHTIETCLDSLVSHTSAEFEVVVVDNSRDEHTWERIQAFMREHPDVRITPIRRKDNPGFAAGCNLGASKASGSRLLFLNPDAQLDNDIVAVFESFWKQTNRPGLLGPRIRDARGNTSRTCRNLPTLLNILLDATGLDRLVGRYRWLNFDHESTCTAPQLIGACLYTSRETYNRFGGMDERFFVYFEEVDLCKRMADAGLDNWFVPDASVTHMAGESCESETAIADMIVQLRRSRTLYFRKHFSVATAVVLAIVNGLEGCGKSIVFAVLHLATGNPMYRCKAIGFLRVVKCFGCWR